MIEGKETEVALDQIEFFNESVSESPLTGDSANIVLGMLVMITSAQILLMMFVKMRRR